MPEGQLTAGTALLDLKIALKTRRDSRSAGGRHREVAPDDVLVRLEEVTTSWCRLRATLRRSKNGQPPPQDTTLP